MAREDILESDDATLMTVGVVDVVLSAVESVDAGRSR